MIQSTIMLVVWGWAEHVNDPLAMKLSQWTKESLAPVSDFAADQAIDKNLQDLQADYTPAFPVTRSVSAYQQRVRNLAAAVLAHDPAFPQPAPVRRLYC